MTEEQQAPGLTLPIAGTLIAKEPADDEPGIVFVLMADGTVRWAAAEKATPEEVEQA